MQIKWIEQKIDYDGSQLAPHWMYKNFGLLGDSLIAFRGRCDVPVARLVDLVDAKEDRPIASDEMLHFLGEFFETDLTKTILLERLLVSLAQQEIIFRSRKTSIVRGGNDLYDGDAKLSVAIATASPVSTLIHFGINISSQGTPVKTKGLNDYGIDPVPFAQALLESFRNEVATVAEARSKVRPVG
jgi:hypothetical protein